MMMIIIKAKCVINVNYTEFVIVEILRVFLPGARQFLFFFFVALSFLIFARISLEDRIIADSFGRVIHGEHVKHRMLNSYKPPLSESEGICAECRCGLSTVTAQCITTVVRLPLPPETQRVE